MLTHCLALCSSLAECHFQVFGAEPSTKVRRSVQPVWRPRGDAEKLVQPLALDTAIRASLSWAVRFTHTKQYQFKGK